MSSSSSKRIAAALAASAALHALLVGGLQAPFGSRWGELAWTQVSNPIRAVLKTAPGEEALAPPAALSSAASIPARRGAPASAMPREPEASPTPAAPATRSVLPERLYFLTRELDVRPGIMTQVEPAYPEAAARRFLSGKVVLRLFIEEGGEVSRVQVLNAEPQGYFEDSAERAFLAARFSPGMKDGRAVKVQMTLEVNFDSADAPKAPAN